MAAPDGMMELGSSRHRDIDVFRVSDDILDRSLSSINTAANDLRSDAYAHEVIGANYFDFDRRCVCGDRTIVLYGDGDEVVVSAPTSQVRFLLVSGLPIGEPVAWYGPIVMNTQEELQLAFKEYQEGTFIKHAKR